MGTESFQGVNWLQHGAGPPPPSSAKVKERVELYLYFNREGTTWKLRLTYTIQILNKCGNFLILYKEIVATWNILHDVPFDLLILQHCKSIVN
jgi:hypothetical protein